MLVTVLQLVQVLSTARDDSSDPSRVREAVDQAMVSSTHTHTHSHTHTHTAHHTLQYAPLPSL